MFWNHNWKKYTTVREDERLRHIPDSVPQQVEVLEQRLVLGSLSGAETGESISSSDQNETISSAPSEESVLMDSGSESLYLNEIDESGSTSMSYSSTSDLSTLSHRSTSDLEPLASSLESSLDALPDNILGTAMSESSVESSSPESASNPDSQSEPSSLESSLTGATDQTGDSLNAVVEEDETSELQVTSGVELDTAVNDQATVPWAYENYDEVVIKYDFRDENGYANEISDEQIARVEEALAAWSAATGGKIQFVQDTEAARDEIVNIGLGDMAAFGSTSGKDKGLGLGGVALEDVDGEAKVHGGIWMDSADSWDNIRDNGNPDDTYDFFTVVAHEIGHIVGLDDVYRLDSTDFMNRFYQVEYSDDFIQSSFDNAVFLSADRMAKTDDGLGYQLNPLVSGFPQLLAAEVQQLLAYGSAVSASNDAIIAIVDRNGSLLGVRAEADVLATFGGNPNQLAFAIDGAISKARTAALFSTGDPTNDEIGTYAPITSRLLQFVSQSSITQREVESNPSLNDPTSTLQGPGFVAAIQPGANFPPAIPNTPPVDLFGIEHTNRDSLRAPGLDGLYGTADDVQVRARFNADPNFIVAGNEMPIPEAYAAITGLNPNARNRGIATLPGGVPIFRDTNGDGVGDTLVGGVGVFFPGTTGYATEEQGFVAGVGQTLAERTNAPKVLEAEAIAFAIAGGSSNAASFAHEERATSLVKAPGPAQNPINDIDIPFNRLDLVGIQLGALGPTAGVQGVLETVNLAQALVDASPLTPSGADLPVDPNPAIFYKDGFSSPAGWIVSAHANPAFAATPDAQKLTAQDVTDIINRGIVAADHTRSQVKLESDGTPGARVRATFAVVDTTGEILGLFGMQDGAYETLDVAVSKARNSAYLSDAAAVQPADQIPGVTNGTALTTRTIRFLSEPRFPDAAQADPPGPYSIYNDPGQNPFTSESVGAAQPANAFQSVYGYDSFNPQTNFRDQGDPTVVDANGPNPVANQSGIIFFPGSIPLYKNGILVGALGVAGDGVDQRDLIAFLAAAEFLPQENGVPKADEIGFRDVRLPYLKYPRNPFA